MNAQRRSLLSALVLVCTPVLLLNTPSAYAVPFYTVTPLGAGIYATAVNNSGEVTGYYYPPGAPFPSAFLYSNGTLTNLGTLGGLSSRGEGINASGRVTGGADLPPVGTIDTGGHAFLYSNGVMQDLGCLGGPYPANCDSGGYAINNSGEVTGESDLANGFAHAFLYSNGSMQDMGTLDGARAFSAGLGINNSGEVTGWSETSSGIGTQHAFLYSNGTMQDLGTLGGFNSVGNGINASGEVTGTSDTGNAYIERAFLYTNGSMQDLGALSPANPSAGLGINDSGEVVGWSDNWVGSPQHAFLYSDGFMYDLNRLIGSEASLYTLGVAVAISENGDIIAEEPTNNGGYVSVEAYLLTPIPNTNFVSEPGTLGLLGLGLTGLGLTLRRRDRLA